MNKKNAATSVAAKKIPDMKVTFLYADNEIQVAELQICLSSHDWYILQNQSFYQELIEFVQDRQTQGSVERPVYQKDLSETWEFSEDRLLYRESFWESIRNKFRFHRTPKR